MNDKMKTWLEGLSKEVSTQDFDLIARSLAVLDSNTYHDETLPWGNRRCVSPCIRDGYFAGIWNWDSAFIATTVSRWDISCAQDCISALTNFQLPDGMFVDAILESGKIVDYISKPPVMATAVEKTYLAGGDSEFLSREYKRLVKNELFWVEKRSVDGMFHYDADCSKNPDYDTNVRFESGWDNSVRWDNYAQQLWPVDLNCFMVMTYRSMSRIADWLSRQGEAALWRQKGEKLAALVNERLFNGVAYVDRNYENGNFSDVLTPASFMPLYIEIVSDDRAEAMAMLACDPDKFYMGMPSVAYDHPEYGVGYWRGPTWLNIAYFAAKGLKNYGFAVADEIKETILNWCDREKRGICETYNSLTGEGLRCKNFSWSAAFIIEFILDF